MKKIVTVIGARPQFIKAAMVSRAISVRADVSEVLVHTGQHYDQNMSEIFFSQMGIPKPDYNLGIGGSGHGAMTGRQLEKIEEVLLVEKPDWLLVYGDTNSTLAAALAAVKLHVPVAHVEAGLRSFNRRMPEEINRIVADHVSTLLFAPVEGARTNLLAEGISDVAIKVVGDVMKDASAFYRRRAIKPAWFDELPINSQEFLLCTIHRAENTDDKSRLSSIFQGLAGSDLPVVLPMHPRTRERICDMGIAIPPNVYATDPVGYLEMVWLEANCKMIATDSGGVQKEAYFHEKPCVTLRDETEWVELIDIGANRLVGADAELIAQAINSQVGFPSGQPQLYGSNVAESIVEILV